MKNPKNFFIPMNTKNWHEEAYKYLLNEGIIDINLSGMTDWQDVFPYAQKRLNETKKPTVIHMNRYDLAKNVHKLSTESHVF